MSTISQATGLAIKASPTTKYIEYFPAEEATIDFRKKVRGGTIALSHVRARAHTHAHMTRLTARPGVKPGARFQAQTRIHTVIHTDTCPRTDPIDWRSPSQRPPRPCQTCKARCRVPRQRRRRRLDRPKKGGRTPDHQTSDVWDRRGGG